MLGIDYFEGESVLHHLGKPGFDWRVWMPPLQKRAPELLGPWLTEVRRRYEGSKFFCVGAESSYVRGLGSLISTGNHRELLRCAVCHGGSRGGMDDGRSIRAPVVP